MKPVRVIVNPCAGSRPLRPTGGLEAVRDALEEFSADFDISVTQGPKHAESLAREAVAQGAELVIAAGGDGTLHEVAQALVRTDVALGILPTGTIMNIARVLGIPRDLREAVRLLNQGVTERIDIGRVRDVYFLEAAGVGLDAAIFHYVRSIVEGGRWTNLVRLLRFAMAYRPKVVHLRSDSFDRRYRALMVVVANAPISGLALPLAPDASVEDHFLDVVVYRGSRFWHPLLAIVGLRLGRRLSAWRRHAKVPYLEVDASVRLPVHADGELIGLTPVRFDIVPRALSVVVGPPSRAGTAASRVGRDLAAVAPGRGLLYR